jgi:diguanylate cyclase (GGDEF)-like protein
VISSNLVTGSVVPLTLLTALSGALCFVVVIMVSAKMFMEDAEQRLHRLALTDYLTGSLNRRGLIEYVSTIRKKKKNPADGLALLLFDIDHFKKINDQYGHQAGDLVLVQFCTLANRIIEDDGVFARMGGEEFALILETSRLEKATTVAEAIRIYLARMPLVAGGMPIAVTVSVGVAFSGAEDADINQMMTIADRALYAAKKAGRNRTVVRDGDNNVVIAADDRPEDPSDNNADRQVAALNRIAAIAKT